MSNPTRHHEYTLGEEIWNSITHGAGAIAVVVATPFLLIMAIRAGSAWSIVGASVFAASMLSLYLASTLYHALPRSKAKGVFRLFDHSAIFLLIAGTYTPFTLGVLRGAWGWTLLGLIWGMAIFGITLKAIPATRHSKLIMGLYIMMGWLVIIAAKPVLAHVPLSGILWIAAGGVAYMGGLVFYRTTRRYGHTVWHFFVIAGTVCHYFAVLWYSS